ncbi:MAG: response regulator [Planctomycetia bacterium]|nr:response regulator [Planctomycetia bacterium]
MEEELGHLRTLLDHLPDFIFVKDRCGRFLVANAATVRSLGATSLEEVRGKTDRDFLPSDRAEAFMADDQRVMNEGITVRDHEELHIDANGRAIWLSTTKVPLRSSDGDVIGIVGICHDITERRMMEAELRTARDVAEAANRAKGEFLARMSHEIRTPINGIIGMTRLTLESELGADQRDFLGMVLSSADALTRIIDDILDFSKIEAGKLTLESVTFRLRDSLADAMRSLALRAQQKGLELVCHVAPDVPDVLVGDEGRLRQVIVNLVGNAIKFTPVGEVVVCVSLASAGSDKALSLTGPTDANPSLTSMIGSNHPGEPFLASGSASPSQGPCTLHFLVRDTGVGIPADRAAAIFEPFEQVDGSITRQYGGTGLGLSISVQLVALMGGRLWMESEPGRGSRFYFTAVFDKAAQADPLPGTPASTDLLGLRVLIVDDNATHREHLKELFGNWQMTPHAAAGGQEALEELKRAAEAGQSYRLVLADAGMPHPNGFDLSEKVAQSPGLAGAVLVMLTSTDLNERVAGGLWTSGEFQRPGIPQSRSAERDKQVGTQATILKPLKHSELLDTILNLVAGRSHQTPLMPPTRLTPSVLSSPLPPLNILMAEDNLINQRLAVRLLERAAHRVTIASNGRLALEALQRECYDIILMDVQMPEMDGLEATEEIRRREQSKGRRTPVIALTAHAMKGDRERCLQAGMDAYVSKPINESDLFAAMEQVLTTYAPGVLSRGRNAPTEPIKDERATGNHHYIEAQALERCGGDRVLLRELIDLFLAELPSQTIALKTAVESRDASTLYRLAHTMKGSVATFAAESAREAALTLETIGRSGEWNGAAEAWEKLRPLLEQLKDELSAFRP